MEAWDRQPEESDRAYHAFRCFCDLGPKRSMRAAYTIYSGHKAPKDAGVPAFFRKWADGYNWQARSTAFDEYQRAQDKAKTSAIRDECLIAGWSQMKSLLLLQARDLKEMRPADRARWGMALRQILDSLHALDPAVAQAASRIIVEFGEGGDADS